jgi:hypothetical protein
MAETDIPGNENRPAGFDPYIYNRFLKKELMTASGMRPYGMRNRQAVTDAIYTRLYSSERLYLISSAFLGT